ncbi:MAG: insulinase family protein [Gammaproteobacteria bacterium]|nr:insulinase family protein [Gammaproteobacteria bacterium]
MKQSLLAALLWLPLFAPGLALAESERIHEYMLDNGMKVLVKEDHRSPVVVSQVWYRVGASDEYGGITGVSHVLEHMMFKGTKAHGPGEFSRIIAENGGRENAFTGKDYTAYFQTLEKSRLEVSFEMEADRMRNLLLPPEEFEKEVKVVMEERRMRTEDNPQALTYEQFNATAFFSSPYHQPIIGWMNDLENLEVADLRRWYERYYAPNNAILVVAGDVEPDEVLGLARKHFGPLKPSELDASKPREEYPQSGVRSIEVKAPAQLPYLLMGYKVPVIRTAQPDWEPYALEVLAGVLDGGNASRLQRQLVRQQELAASVGAGYSPISRYDELFTIEATPARGVRIEDLERAIGKQIQRLHTKLISDEELKRVKAQVVASKVYQQDSLFYQAMELGMLETTGVGWRVGQDYEARIDEVTPEQVRTVARKYLVEEGLTIAQLVPLKQNGEVRDATH